MNQLVASMMDPRKKLEQFQSLTTDYEKKLVEASSYESFYVSRLRADKGAKLLDFIDDMRELWRKRFGKNEENLVEIVRKNATRVEDSRDTAITFKVMNREVSPDFNDVKPKYRMEMEHPLHTDQHVQIYGQMLDITMEFGIHSRTHEEADRIMEEFEDFLEDYTQYFTRSGIQDLRFIRQLEDTSVRDGEGEIHSRTLLYLIRVERIKFKYLNEIKHVELQAKLYKQQ